MKDTVNHQIEAHTPDRRRDSRAFTDAKDVAEAFDHNNKDQSAAVSGARHMQRNEEREQGLDERLAAGDADARASVVSMQDAAAVGQEGIAGGQNPPDQSNVDDIGSAVGLQYEDNEPIDIGKKIVQRDRTERWELNPASSDDWPRKI